MQNNSDSVKLASNYQQRATENADTSLYEYDVFLSFRGPDTRKSFTDVLYDHMSQAGLRVFRDDDELKLGDMINKILPAIDNSKLCIPIFSKTFASSKWCLWEVTRMVELQKQILPIFYDVTVEDINLETPVYDKFMARHVTDYGENEVDKWKEALKTISTIEGKEVLNTGYTTFCGNFVQELLVKLKSRKKIEIDHAIGLEGQVQYAMQLLDIHSTSVRYIGIYGMGGIGKTTLAKDIFNRITNQFESCCFLEDVRESCRRRGITYLLEKLLSSHTIPTFERDSEHLSRMMGECFRKKKVLIVLDDIDQREQIEKLAGKSNWFGAGSRIIVTTRNRSVIETGDRKLSKDEVCNFEMELLGHDNALQLFKLHAFKEGIVATGFQELSKEVASLTGGLPLALKIIGSLLYNRRREVWEEIMEKLKEIPESEVKKRLKISYDTLTDGQKQIFLDIACFFVGSLKTYPIYMWKACKFCPLSGLEALCSMSLVKVSIDGAIWMHDQLRDLGRDIVREESINIPAKRSRLWDDEKARKVLMSTKDKEIVEALRLEGYCVIDLMQVEIGSLENMRYLELQHSNLSGDFESLLPNLRWLSYHSDENFEATNFAMTKLVILDLSGSSINENWGGWSQLKNAKNLKVLDLSGAKQLRRTPCFPEDMTLDMLILDGCSQLEAIDGSIGNLKCLKYLALRDCVSLTGLPDEVGHLEHLISVHITGGHQCFDLPKAIGNLVELRFLVLKFLKLRELPESCNKLRNLVVLDLGDTEILNLPDAIEGLVKLEILCLGGCSKVKNLPHTLGALKSLVILELSHSGLVELPPSVGELARLQHLRLSHCYFMEKLPDSLGGIISLVELDLTFAGIVELPDSIGLLKNLKRLCLSDCSNMTTLPNTIGNLKSLVKLELSRTIVTELPGSIGCLENLAEIGLGHCRQLKTLPKSFGALKKLEKLDAESADLSGELPDEISKLSSLRYLNLFNSRVCKLPSSIHQLPLLHTLVLDRCVQLLELPYLPENLNVLSVSSRSLHKVHDLSKLKRLTRLTLASCLQSSNSDFGIGMLSQLIELRLCHPAITTLPEEFRNLTQLKLLSLDCPNLKSAPLLPPNLETMYIWFARQDISLPNLPDLKKLSFLEVKHWSGGGTLGLLLPESLRDLYVSDCSALESLPNISGFKNLRNLYLLRCQSLVLIPGLGKLKSLQYLDIECCRSLIELENLSELNEINNVRIACCGQLRGIKGVDDSKISILGGHFQEMSKDRALEVIIDEFHDISSLLSSPGRNFLIRNNGRQVKIDCLKGKKVCLYFCGSFWETYNSLLVTAYRSLYPQGDFEVVFVSGDEGDNDGPFRSYFYEMPWLAIPFSDSEKRRSLSKLFKVHEDSAPQLLIFNEIGKVTANGFEILGSYGRQAYPFTPEKIEEVKSIIQSNWSNQSLRSIFANAACDSVLSYDGKQIPVSDLEGKIVGIYFSSSSDKECTGFTHRLREVYQQLKGNGESFEIVWAAIEADEDSYSRIFRTVPWLALSTRFPGALRLYSYFSVSTLPALVILGGDGETLQPNAVEAVEKFGAKAYPFTPEKIMKAREEAERLVISACRKLAIANGQGGDQVHEPDLMDKNILLYFSAQRIDLSCTLLSKLIEAYCEIKERDDGFEIIFISDDQDEASFHTYFSMMPWLALPLRNEWIPSLCYMFDVRQIPKLVAIGPKDEIITKEAITLLAAYGSDAYPFNDDEHIRNMAKGWPQKLQHARHAHELALTQRNLRNVCDGCNMEGHAWSYYCDGCDFDLHPKCALTEGKREMSEEREPCD